ncbi:MAG: hypothetical protein JO248_07445, partial [Acidimicrobiia bacterium]|nr:hypothetical protein [Acidimicrobiia bacterium]
MTAALRDWRMKALGPWLRAELRLRWRSRAALLAVAALVGGAVITAAAGARRTDTALHRLVVATNASGVNLSPPYPGLDRLPEVRAVDTLVGEPLLRVLPNGRVDNQFPSPVASADGRVLYRTLRVVLRDGRLPYRADEGLATVEAARQQHLRVGSQLTLRDLSGVVGPKHLSVPSSVAPEVGTVVRLRIVGIGVDYNDVAAASARSQQGQGAFGTIYLSPAYVAAHGGPGSALYNGAFLELRPGADMGRLRREIDALAA